MSQRPSIARTVFGMSLVIFGSALVAGAQDEGVKQIQQLIKRATSGVEAITEAKLQVQKTMTAYNGVLAPDAKDRRDAYKKLQKEMEDVGKETCHRLDTIQ